jgi:transcriptional regulator with XRE-family HTH domain
MTTQLSERIPEWTQGDRLRKAREMLGMGQREFADHIGVSHQTITNAEKGHRAVRKITLNAWALATGVPASWLETGETPSPEPPDGPDGPSPVTVA